ncbi:flavin-containing monooxygenase [Neoroseomonas oryzicola]|uniref:NAD(P)/FAD-dependent oxidoreductase n=1 Tax=Neoroseomonas oryzicola TaxID=535904 RepID=A0A9X9WD24_9PROT|nr:NAD(P)/FAD-dependent oxidoreductase [Neoroseomonas oryzicola]MBR0658234.1 NAD(P)/FAD-dependent oxidoreductase [Neoroseomonas oryzicola]NKE15949.1 NAD(P)/FAD-dependent oxidoreductase [Neoroseomonas oryzicola]
MDGILTGTTVEAAAEAWLGRFQAAMDARDEAAIAALFATESHWRDILAFTWNLRTASGADAIAERLAGRLAAARPRGVALAARRTPPRRVTRAGTEAIEVIFTFETVVGPCNGVVRLVSENGETRAWTLMTALDEIRGHEDPANGTRWQNVDWKRNFGGENWLDRRKKAVAYADRDPAVLVVGASQSGMTIAARLSLLGVDTLVIDKDARIGDSWRKRYHALTLHNETRVNHLPYMPFPRSWPVFIPKDMLANWFELYAEAMEINTWTGTELTGGSWDEAAQCWDVTLKRADGSERRMRPRHIVMANGVSSIPIMPDLPGLKDFKGVVRHSGAVGSGLDWAGKRALVLGTGTSGHDVAQDLAVSGAAEVTLIQRRPTLVVSLKEAQAPYALYDEDIPFEDKDLLATSFPFPIYKRAHQRMTRMNEHADKALLDGLKEKGFRLTSGPDGTGWQIMYQQRGGGYYFDAGCSQMIIDGKVGLIQFDDIDRFGPEGAIMKDGTTKPADLIVLATGYEGQAAAARRLFGDAVADRVGKVWGWDEEGELHGMWRPTGQPGLWFHAGGLAQCRIFSKVLALQIKARELGLPT